MIESPIAATWTSAATTRMMHAMPLYHEGNRRFQDRFDTRRLADRIEERIVHDTIDDDDRAFIEARDMFFLATADADGRPQCSYKGGDPGFVRVLTSRRSPSRATTATGCTSASATCS